MVLYFGEEQEKVYRYCVLKKNVIRLITGFKNVNPLDRNLKKLEFLR
jgi:hypothetical protein